jgi:hypothetical protein
LTESGWHFSANGEIHNHDLIPNCLPQRVSDISSPQLSISAPAIRAGLPVKQLCALAAAADDKNPISRSAMKRLRTKLQRTAHNEQSAVEWLRQHGWIVFVRTQNNFLDSLLCLLPAALDLAVAYSHVWCFDSTFGLLRGADYMFFEGVSVTSIGQHSPFLFSIHHSKSEADYIWILSNLRTCLPISFSPDCLVSDSELALISSLSRLFPHSILIRCRWHMHENITKHHSCLWSSDVDRTSFYSFLYECEHAQSEDLFNTSWSNLICTIPKANGKDYMLKTWFPCRQQWSDAWLNQHPTLNVRSNSRSESQHSALKSYLKSPSFTLMHLANMLNAYYCQHLVDLKDAYSQQAHSVQTVPLDPHTLPVKDSLSRWALSLLSEEWGKVHTETEQPCSNRFSSSMLLPCRHLLRECLTNETDWSRFIHEFWFLSSCPLLVPDLRRPTADYIINSNLQRSAFFATAPDPEPATYKLHLKKANKKMDGKQKAMKRKPMLHDWIGRQRRKQKKRRGEEVEDAEETKKDNDREKEKEEGGGEKEEEEEEEAEEGEEEEEAGEGEEEDDESEEEEEGAVPEDEAEGVE